MPHIEPRRLAAFADLYGEGRKRAPKRLGDLDEAARCYLAWARSQSLESAEVDGLRTTDPYSKAAAWYRQTFASDRHSQLDTVTLAGVIEKNQDKMSRWLNDIASEREIEPS